MGKTDILIMEVYKALFEGNKRLPLAFFGAVPGDKLATKITTKADSIDFYDIRLKNKGNEYHWDMNEVNWAVQKKYGSIVFMRSSGFSKNPRHLLRQFKKILAPEGRLMIDWLMGSDHFTRDDPSGTWTWGWEYKGHRCYGTYEKKRYELFSSALLEASQSQKAFAKVSRYSEGTKRYAAIKGYKAHRAQIHKEFKHQYLLQDVDIKNHFIIESQRIWTPIHQNGRAQLYTIQVLRK